MAGDNQTPAMMKHSFLVFATLSSVQGRAQLYSALCSDKNGAEKRRYLYSSWAEGRNVIYTGSAWSHSVSH